MELYICFYNAGTGIITTLSRSTRASYRSEEPRRFFFKCIFELRTQTYVRRNGIR